LKPQVLIIDDEPDILELLSMTLSAMSVDCITAENIAQAEQALDKQSFDLCLTDMRLPDGSGLDFVSMLQKNFPALPVAVISAHGNMDLAVQALKLGAFDFVSKPLKVRALRELVSSALKLSTGKRGIKERRSRSQLLGETEVIKALRGKITKLARSQTPVYISGESGTGKELVAKLIHELGARSDKAFVPINCGAIPADLVESELFGHKKGSFTGAISDKEGLFQAAHGGTLFLDEVADLPLMMQVKLLRAIQEKMIRPVGGHEEISVDVRVLSATHKDLAASVRSGNFREDLYYRLNVIEIVVPPLRQRQNDIVLLAEHIFNNIAARSGGSRPSFSQEAMQTLNDYAFPGNVRELENILERAITWADGDVIDVDDLMLPRVEANKIIESRDSTIIDNSANSSETLLLPESDLGSQLEQQERELIKSALEETHWNKTAAAKKLGITFRALRYKLKKLNLE